MKFENGLQFEELFINIGDWNFGSYKKQPKCKILAADIETKLYLNEKVLTDDEAYCLLKTKKSDWVRSNIEVKPYAFMLANKENFCCFTNIRDFIKACCILNVEYVFWYNAKFDFSIFDYYFLTNGWVETQERIKNNKNYGKLKDKTYFSLNGEFGQRYSLRIWGEYINNSAQKKVHNFKMHDICNIFPGGLSKNLEDWDIRDCNGNKIRKLEMNYSEASFENDLQYMINDTKGLYYLSEKINETMKEITDFSLFEGDYLTAGGLAKKTLLNYMYGDYKKEGKRALNIEYPMNERLDEFFREKHLYRGGISLVNKNKIGVVVKDVYKFDVNSMYPHKMKTMRYPVGCGCVKYNIEKNDKLKVLYVKEMAGILKENMISIWQNLLTKEYDDIIFEEDFLIWEEEYNELKNWYDIDIELNYVIEYNGIENKGSQKFIDTFFNIKCNNIGCIKNGAKLLINSSYGKWAQRLKRRRVSYKLAELGYVHAEKGDEEIDKKQMMSVLVGSRITSLARVSLMEYIRKICKNVKKNFIYGDTDSVHSLLNYDDVDDKELGKMKREGIYKYGLYLAPKSYLLYDYNKQYEVHCKGVNTKVVYNEIKGKSFYEATKIFKAGRTFKCLSAINVRGGKALIYIDKMILNDDDYTCDRRFVEQDGDFYEI